MATSPTVAKAKTAGSSTEAQPAEFAQIPGLSRREFLYYAWAGSMALLLAQTGGILVWFGLPRFRAGEFGGTFTVNSAPPPGSPPVDNPAGKFWLTTSEDNGITAIYKVCTHLGCLYKWVDANNRFECPCHGSKFNLTGTYIEGPAPRSLDRFHITVVTSGGTLESNPAGDPVVVSDVSSVSAIIVDTGTKIKRAGRV